MSLVRLFATAGVIVLCAAPAWAQAAGPVNPSTVTFIAPTTNADGSPLLDLSGYNYRVAGPLSGNCPTFSQTGYPVKRSVAAGSATPAANTIVKLGTDGAGTLTTDLGLTQDGQYCIGVTAVDLALNEGAVSATVPFVRNRVAPSAPTGIQVNP